MITSINGPDEKIGILAFHRHIDGSDKSTALQFIVDEEDRQKCDADAGNSRFRHHSELIKKHSVHAVGLDIMKTEPAFPGVRSRIQMQQRRFSEIGWDAKSILSLH